MTKLGRNPFPNKPQSPRARKPKKSATIKKEPAIENSWLLHILEWLKNLAQRIALFFWQLRTRTL